MMAVNEFWFTKTWHNEMTKWMRKGKAAQSNLFIWCLHVFFSFFFCSSHSWCGYKAVAQWYFSDKQQLFLRIRCFRNSHYFSHFVLRFVLRIRWRRWIMYVVLNFGPRRLQPSTFIYRRFYITDLAIQFLTFSKEDMRLRAVDVNVYDPFCIQVDSCILIGPLLSLVILIQWIFILNIHYLVNPPVVVLYWRD